MPPILCCCGKCYGCCFPYDYLTSPDVPVGQEGNYAQIIRWEIDAPNCPAIDGLTGQFSPETTGPHDPLVECGFCLCYRNSGAEIAIISGVARFEMGEDCGSTPCGINLCFGLQCARIKPPTDPDDPERCCKQFRLIVLFTGATPTGGEPVDTESQCFEGEGIAGNANFPGCNGESQDPVLNGTQLEPSTCQCEDPEDPETTPFELVFDLSVLGFGCPEGSFVGGPCDGLSRCCTPTACSFEGATLTATRL